MPEADEQTLTRFSDSDLFLIKGITSRGGDEHYLGRVGISYRHPTFEAGGISCQLSPESRFMLMRSQHVASKVFVVFRQFDSSPDQAFPEDHVAGWLPAEQAADAEGWIDRMNVVIAAYNVTDV